MNDMTRTWRNVVVLPERLWATNNALREAILEFTLPPARQQIGIGALRPLEGQALGVPGKTPKMRRAPGAVAGIWPERKSREESKIIQGGATHKKRARINRGRATQDGTIAHQRYA
jgi:hypothetical protein